MQSTVFGFIKHHNIYHLLNDIKGNDITYIC